MRLLISVTDAAEAHAALQGGADIIDVKNPAEGRWAPPPLARCMTSAPCCRRVAR